jgi:hypothetical protein
MPESTSKPHLPHKHRPNTPLGSSALARLAFALGALLLLWITTLWALA